MFRARYIRASPVFLTAFHKSRSPFCRDHNYVAHAMTRAMKYSSTESLPRIAQPSFLQLLVPKFLRQSESKPSPARVQRSKQWNPATFFIVIFLFIGSNAIQMIALRTDFKNFSRKAEVKIGLLQDAIERLHRGEVVDVERLLGSGDEQQEREWEDVLREIQDEDRLWQKDRSRKKAIGSNSKDKEKGLGLLDSAPRFVNDAHSTAAIELKSSAPPGFY